MKQSLFRAPKAGILLGGKMKKAPPPILNPQASPNSECLDVSFSASPPPISNITDNDSVTPSNSVTAAADEIESNYSGLPEFPAAPLVKPVEAATENLKEASTFVEPASFNEDIILTESSEVAAQDEGERNLELVLAGFSKAMEKLFDAIKELLLLEIEQRKRRNRNDGVLFHLVRVGELMLAFLMGAVLVLVLLTAVDPEGYLILNNLSKFNGPAPT